MRYKKIIAALFATIILISGTTMLARRRSHTRRRYPRRRSYKRYHSGIYPFMIMHSVSHAMTTSELQDALYKLNARMNDLEREILNLKKIIHDLRRDIESIKQHKAFKI